MARQVDRDHLVAGGQRCEDGRPDQARGADAVDEQQGGAAPGSRPVRVTATPSTVSVGRAGEQPRARRARGLMRPRPPSRR